MSWVQVGPHKVNTALICYVEQEGDTVRIYFAGEWEGNPLDLHFDEAKQFWRHLKAEDVMMTKDKGSAAVLPKMKTGGSGSSGAIGVYGVGSDDEPAKEKPKMPQPASGSSSSSHSSSHHGSSHHPHSTHKRH
jgi:hypothetical protein